MIRHQESESKGSLVYFISHNIARKELLADGRGGFGGEGWSTVKVQPGRFQRNTRR